MWNTRKKLKALSRLVEESGMFDSSWYLEKNPDVKNAGVDPLIHFIEVGGCEGRSPSEKFNSVYYLKKYTDVENSGMNPLVHYLKFGKVENRLAFEKPRHTLKSNRQILIDDLIKKLWAGFSFYAKRDLESFVFENKKGKSIDKAKVLYNLARRYASEGDWFTACQFLLKIKKYDVKFFRNKRTKLLLIEGFIQQSLKDRAMNYILPTLDGKFDSDYYCAQCNLKEDGHERLEIINDIYLNYGLAPVSFLDKEKAMSFGNITVNEELMFINGGPLVSVLVPVYNAEQYIKTAISSLLRQTWSNIEIVAVDDCSKDNSYEILQELAKTDQRLKVYRNTNNMGAYGTRNRALEFASGDFITVHDSDDWSHPQMMEIQMGAMLSDPLVKATCSMMARVTPDLKFVLRPQRNNLDYVHRSYPSLLIRKKDLALLGKWDGVSANADDEFVQRVRMLWGKDSVKDVLKGVPLSLFLVHDQSLTQNSKTSLNSLTFGVRHEYARQAKYWKENRVDVSSRHIIANRKTLKEPFPIPSGLAPNNWKINRSYDLVIISDLSLLGGTRRCNEGYIRAAINAGLRVGLFHWPRYDLKVAQIANEYTELSYLDDVDFLVHEDEIKADLVLIHHPPILKYEIEAVPTTECKKLAILVNQSPMQLHSETAHYYKESETRDLIKKLFNIEPIWIPIAPSVVDILNKTGENYKLHHEIWYPPYTYEMPCSMPIHNVDLSRAIILGRHSRDHWTKWPEKPEDISFAYCANQNDIETRLLGGANTPKNKLGSIPGNWTILKFDSVSVSTFVEELDFFVHFTHADYIEEFGRNIMEAMAAGKVVILPEAYEVNFGDAAVYCVEKEVGEVVRHYSRNSQEYRAQALKGFNFVKSHCALNVVERKIQSLVSGVN